MKAEATTLVVADTLARAQQLLQRPVSPTVAELEQLNSSKAANDDKLATRGTMPEKKTLGRGHGSRGTGKDNSEAYHHALDVLDELTRQMKEKKRTMMREGTKHNNDNSRIRGYDWAQVERMRMNIEKLEGQLKADRGALKPPPDKKGVHAARARIRAKYNEERNTTAAEVVKEDSEREERKILQLQCRVAETLRSVARERRARVRSERIAAEEGRRRKAMNDEKAVREQHAAARRVTERARQAREDEVAQREAHQRQAQARLAANKARVTHLRQRTRERMKKKKAIREEDILSREHNHHHVMIDNEEVIRGRRLAARRAREVQRQSMKEQEEAAARQAKEENLRQRQLEEMVKRYR